MLTRTEVVLNEGQTVGRWVGVGAAGLRGGWQACQKAAEVGRAFG